MTGKPGDNQFTEVRDNVMHRKARQGNSRTYTLDRLKRERPDLFQRVAAKELSAHLPLLMSQGKKYALMFKTQSLQFLLINVSGGNILFSSQLHVWTWY